MCTCLRTCINPAHVRGKRQEGYTRKGERLDGEKESGKASGERQELTRTGDQSRASTDCSSTSRSSGTCAGYDTSNNKVMPVMNKSCLIKARLVVNTGLNLPVSCCLSVYCDRACPYNLITLRALNTLTSQIIQIVILTPLTVKTYQH